MKAAVVGPGAMGCLIAGLLAEAGQDILLLDHDAARARVLADQGVLIEDAGASRSIPLNTGSDPCALRDAELIFLCVKSNQTGAAMAGMRGCVHPGAAVISLQNGLGNVEQIAAVVGEGLTVGGVTSLGATRLGTGHVRHAGSGVTSLAAWHASGAAAVDRAAKVLTAAGVNVKVVPDCRSMLWSKLVVSAAINPLTALSGVCNGDILAEPSLREAARAVAAEAMAVAASQHVGLMFEDGMAEVGRVCEATARNVSSMLQDIRAGRCTEIDAINGRLVEFGRSGGIDVPANSILVEAIRALEGRR